MNNLRYGLLAARLLILLLVGFGMCQTSWAQGQQIIFSATGDVPYGSSEVTLFQQQMTNHNKYSPSKFFIHVGDILAGSESCNESRYSDVANIMKSLAVPAYIAPGDNETVDCSSPSSGMALFMKYFQNYEQNFCGAPYTERQTIRPENWAFVMDGVLFVGLNLVYGNNVLVDAASWAKQQLEAKGSQVRAAVFFAHYAPGSAGSSFSTPFRAAAATFAKPILFLHGHGHSWSTSYPFPEENIFRVQVNRGGSEDPVEVKVTMDNTSPATAFIFKRSPWSSKTLVNMPPCANAGPDKTISGLSTSLQGAAKDDGDSGSTLTTTWSVVSGPGTVSFGNVNSPTSLVSFSTTGVYVLRLTANDGQLKNSDDVSIGVNTAIGNAPLVSSFTPTSGAEGTAVSITGSNFTGITGVTFNGTIATSYSVVSSTQIMATVPTGATTGKISVSNTYGTGLSGSDFNVTGAGTTLTFNPTADTHVQSFTATTNYGLATELRVETNSASDVSNIYMKFDVTGVNGSILSAKLRLVATDGSSNGGSLYLVSNDYPGTSTPWEETGLIWNNAPAITGSVLATMGSVSSGQIIERDLTSTITGNGVYSFAINSSSSNAAMYSSKEGNNKPALILQIATNPPVVSNFSPASGLIGVEVTITGSKFSDVAHVAFNGTAASFVIDSDTQIRATVPASATSGKISLTNPDGGTGFSATDFTVFSPPSIASFAPAQGPTGTEVTITGSYFMGTTAVTINGMPASFTVDSDTQIRATVPSGAPAGAGKIVVTNAMGSTTSVNDFTVTTGTLSTIAFAPVHDTYVVFSSPTSNKGTASTIRVLKSASEEMNSYLKFEVTGLNGTLLSAKLRLYVSDAGPDGGAVYLVSDNYLNSTTPWIEKGMTWNNAPSITGTALSSTGAVSLDQWVEFNVTMAIVGNGIYSFGLKNNNSDKVYYRAKENGTATSPQLVIESISSAAPSITSFAPVDGPIGSEVTINGNNFTGTTAVTFNGVPSNFVIDSNTKIRATVPTGATTGRIVVTNADGSISHAQNFTITVQPVITSFTPNMGAAGNQITITGSHFTGTTSVTINGAAATIFYLDSDTQIRADIPTGAPVGTGKIVVTNSAGSATSAADFTVNVLLSFAPQYDVYVTSVYPTTNYGTVSTLRGKLGSSEINHSYLKFNVTGVTGAIRSAKLRLKVSNASPDGGAVYVASNNYLNTTTPWDEIGLIWNNAPGISGTPLSSIGAVIVDQWVEFDVTSAVASDGVYSFGLKTNNSDAVYYRAKENGTATSPQLIIESTATAAPSIASFAPVDGPIGSEVTINGNNFTGTTAVTFNGVPSNFVIDSNTKIRATVPTGATTGRIVVTNSAGSATSAADFTVNVLLSFAPQHDVYVTSYYPTTNYGTVITLRGKLGSSEINHSYLKFNVTGVTGAILSAKLRLKVSNASPDGGAVYVASNNYLNTTTPWDEIGLIWNNAPGISGTPLSSIGAVIVDQWVEFDVTSAVASDGIYSFGLKTNNSDAVYYRAKENGVASSPQLVIQIAASGTAAKRAGSEPEVENIVAAIPTEFVLQQNYPNPFSANGTFGNPSTNISFGLPQTSQVTIKMYTLNGQEVRTLVNGEYPAGMHTVTFHAYNLPSGTYFYVMQAGNVRQVRRLMLVK